MGHQQGSEGGSFWGVRGVLFGGLQLLVCLAAQLGCVAGALGLWEPGPALHRLEALVVGAVIGLGTLSGLMWLRGARERVKGLEGSVLWERLDMGCALNRNDKEGLPPDWSIYWENTETLLEDVGHQQRSEVASGRWMAREDRRRGR